MVTVARACDGLIASGAPTGSADALAPREPPAAVKLTTHAPDFFCPMALPILAFAKIAARDVPALRLGEHDFDLHFSSAIDWLRRAHDVGDDDGVSYGYSLRGGWRPSYIETTGYIACTFYELAKRLRRAELRDRATRMARWLVRVQNGDGSFGNPRYAPGRGIVFDTGQDLFGLVRGHIETSDPELLDAAERAGDWLVEVADAEGRWTRSTHLGIPHVYNSRVAWALLELHGLSPHADRERVARANLDWAVSRQSPAGWFRDVAFEPGVAPFTHTIAYAIRGLWEASRLVASPAWEEAAVRGADAVLSRLHNDGFLPGQIDADGRPVGRYCCLTGNAQMAIVWAKLHRATSERRYREAAVRAVRYVMATQDVETSDSDVRGAIKGSHPIWGRYSPMTYPNWAAKFFVDAMLQTREWL